MYKWKICKYVLKKGNLKESKKILDVGCGLGEQDIYWSERIKGEITCIDICDELIEDTKNLIQKRGYSDRINAKQGNACDLKFENNSFDTVISLESAFHYNTRKKFLEESYRVLEKGGKLILADLLVTDDKIDIFNKKFQETFICVMNIPKPNLITPQQLVEELETIGFKVKLYDITEQTFKPFYKFFFENYKSNSIVNKIANKTVVQGYINNLCNGTNGFKYIVVVCEKY